MSTAPNTPAAPLDANTAYSVVFQRVHAPIFFQKLAARNIHPANAEEANTMLEMGSKLHDLYDQEQQQKTAGHTNLLKQASAHLDNLLGKAAAPAAPPAASRVKEAAVQASFDPAIAHAVLSILTSQN